MTRIFNISILLLYCGLVFANQSLIFESRVATALNSVTLHPDSSLTAHSNSVYLEGTLFEVLDESYYEHEDDSQNQKYKWFKVRSPQGEEGWIFGDGLAVILQDQEVEYYFKQFHKQRASFGKGFDDVVMWMARIVGRDNFHEKDYMNPVYDEYYLVITNKLGRSVQLNVGGENMRGKSKLHDIEFRDITGDRIDDIIIQKSTFPADSKIENREVNIFSWQGGTLMNVLQESVTLSYRDGEKSPALFKYLEVKENVVRVEYIDFVDCSRYQQKIATGITSVDKERCVEFVTYSYHWNSRKKKYEILYDETRTPPRAVCKYENTKLRNHPDQIVGNSVRLSRSQPLKIIKTYEKEVLRNRHLYKEYYFLVQTRSGVQGYIPAEKLGFINAFHSALLTSYFYKPPTSNANWNSSIPFLKFVEPKERTASR